MPHNDDHDPEWARTKKAINDALKSEEFREGYQGSIEAGEFMGPDPADDPDFIRANDNKNQLLRGLMSSQKLIIEQTSTPSNIAQNFGGINQKRILEATPYFNAGEAEGAQFADGGIKGFHNTFIIMGRDRPGSKETGNGSNPATHCGCIDIIAGLSGILARETSEQDSPTQWKDGLSQQVAAVKVRDKVVSNKSTELDAARIYLTQRAINIDGPEYFNLAQGKVGYKQNQSACVIKADAVRLVARNGIKIITSGDSWSGSVGENIKHRIRGIDLIAGNNDKDLQPLVKGNALLHVINSQTELTEDLHASVFYLYSLLVYFMFSLFDPTGTAASRLTSQLKSLPQEFINLFTQEINFVIHELNYNTSSNPFAKHNFLSRYNTTN